VVFSDQKIHNYRDVLSGNQVQLLQFNKVLREKGLLKAINKFYVHLALTEADLEQTFDAIESAAASLE